MEEIGSLMKDGIFPEKIRSSRPVFLYFSAEDIWTKCVGLSYIKYVVAFLAYSLDVSSMLPSYTGVTTKNVFRIPRCPLEGKVGPC